MKVGIDMIEEIMNDNIDLRELDTNKSIYLVIVEGSSLAPDLKAFFSKKIEQKGHLLDIIGYEVNPIEAKKVRSNKEAIALAAGENNEPCSLLIPIYKVINITNISYYHRNKL